MPISGQMWLCHRRSYKYVMWADCCKTWNKHKFRFSWKTSNTFILLSWALLLEKSLVPKLWSISKHLHYLLQLLHIRYNIHYVPKYLVNVTVVRYCKCLVFKTHSRIPALCISNPWTHLCFSRCSVRNLACVWREELTDWQSYLRSVLAGVVEVIQHAMNGCSYDGEERERQSLRLVCSESQCTASQVEMGHFASAGNYTDSSRSSDQYISSIFIMVGFLCI